MSYPPPGEPIGREAGGGLPSEAGRPRPPRAGSWGSKGPPSLNETPDVLALVKALRYRWRLAMALGACAAAVAAGVAWVVVPAPKHRATVLLQVAAQPPKVLMETSETVPEFKIYQATQLALLKSRMVLNAALRRPEVAALEGVKSQADPVDWLEGRIKAELPAGSELLQLSMTGARPDELAALVNAVADAYMEEIVTREHGARLARFEELKGLLASYRESLSAKRTALRKLAETVGSDNLQTLALTQQLALQQLARERGELLRVQAELKRGGVEQDVLEVAERSKAEVPVADGVIDEALEREIVVQRLKDQAAELAVRYRNVRRLVRLESDPSLLRVRKDLEASRRQLDATRARLRPAIERQCRAFDRNAQAARLAELKTENAVLARYEGVLRSSVERLDAESKAFTRGTLDLRSKQDEIELEEATARKIGTEVEALTVELKAPRRVRLIERAEGPRMENATKRPIAIAMAALGAFGAAVLGVAWREYRTRRVASVDEVVDGLGMRLVGTIPALPPGRSRAPRRQDLLVESIDAARTMLLRDLRAESLRVVMITSASKGEGKSSLSSHLAISLARTGRRTLLVDFDLRSPSVHRLFDIPEGPGACELLRGEAGIDDAATPVLDGLDVIAAGACDAGAIRALGQDGLPMLLEGLRARYDFIVIDSAPVLPVADSLLISQHVDAVLFSVYREVSRLPAVHAGYQRLATLGVRMLGAVVAGIPSEHYDPEYLAADQPGPEKAARSWGKSPR